MAMAQFKSRGGHIRKLGVLLGAFMFAAGAAIAGGPNGGAGTPGPVPNATVGATPFTNINLVTDACNGVSGTLSITATGTTDDGGGFDNVFFTIWDDGVQKFNKTIAIPVGSTTTTVVTVLYAGGVGTSAPGIGLTLGESAGSSNLFFIDPYFPAVVGGCAIGQSAVPTLSQWALWLLAGLVGLMGVGLAWRRRRF
jgi:hypothetical protein